MARSGTKRGAQPRGGGGGGGQRHGLWLLAGLLAGWLTAFGVYLLGIMPTALEIRERNKAADCAGPGAEKPAREAAAGDKPAGDKPVTFEFYTMLPQQEVVAPVAGERTTHATPPPQPAEKPAAAANAAAAGTAAPAAAAPRFLLQAGSFRTRAEADRRRAELTLSGHSVNVQDVKTGSGETWYRVMVGPYADEAAMQKARQQLAAGKVDTLPVRIK